MKTCIALVRGSIYSRRGGNRWEPCEHAARYHVTGPTTDGDYCGIHARTFIAFNRNHEKNGKILGIEREPFYAVLAIDPSPTPCDGLGVRASGPSRIKKEESPLTTMAAPAFDTRTRIDRESEAELLANLAADFERLANKNLQTALAADSLQIRRLGASAYRCLNIIEANPGVQPSSLAAWMHMETHSVSGLLNRMEDAELIERRRGKVDRRVVMVYITPAGRMVGAKARAVFGEVNAVVTESFGREGLAVLSAAAVSVKS